MGPAVLEVMRQPCLAIISSFDSQPHSRLSLVTRSIGGLVLSGAIASLSLGCAGRLADDSSDGHRAGIAADSADDEERGPSSSSSSSSSQSSSQLAPLPVARTDHSVATVGGIVYAMGGSTGGSMLKRVDAYDPATNTWTQKADMLGPRRGFASAVIDGKIYVAGGMSFTDWNNVTYVGTTEVYDPATDTWTNLAPLPLPAAPNQVWGNLFVGGGTVGGLFYVVGSLMGQQGDGSFMRVYDPVTNTWTEETAAPFGNAQLATVTIGGTLYVAASGYYAPPGTTLWAWDPASHQWSVREGLREAWRSAYVSANGKLYAVGGVAGDMSVANATASVHEYDPAANAWTQGASIQVARQYAGAAEVDGVVYVIGGDVPEYGVAYPEASAAVEAMQL